MQEINTPKLTPLGKGAGLLGLLSQLAPLFPSKVAQFDYHSAYDPEMLHADALNNTRDLLNRLPYINLGQPPERGSWYVNTNRPSNLGYDWGGNVWTPEEAIAINKAESERLRQIELEDEAIKARRSGAVSGWSQLEGIFEKQLAKKNKQMDEYRSEYKRKYGRMPSVKEAKLYRAHLGRLNNEIIAGDVIRSQYDQDQSGYQDYRLGLPQPIGLRRINGMLPSRPLVDAKTGNKLFLPNMRNVPAGRIW